MQIYSLCFSADRARVGLIGLFRPLNLFDRRPRDVTDQILPPRQLLRVLLPLHRPHERLGIEEDLDRADFQRIRIDLNSRYAEHVDHFPFAGIGAILAREIAPVTPAEDNVWWPREGSQHLPGESVSEGSSKNVVRSLEVIVETALLE